MDVVDQIGQFGTLLVLRGIGISTYAVRGLTQTLDYIDQASDLRRGVNANLIDFSNPSFRKLKSTISCKDRRPPPLLVPGQPVTIECCCYLGFSTGATGATGSTGAYSQLYTAATGSFITEGEWTFYRPVLDMVFKGFNMQVPEYDADVNWAMDFEQD